MAAIWWDTKEIHTHFNGGRFRCPRCGEYCPSSITGYRYTTRIWSFPVSGAKTNWQRVCSACGQGGSITKKEAQKAAVENNEWPTYINSVKIPAFLGLGILLAAIGAVLLYTVVAPHWTPVYRAEDTNLSTLDSGTGVTFDTLYLLDYYGYETNTDTDEVTSYFFLAYYYKADDTSPCFISLRIGDSDDLFGMVRNTLDADGNYVGDLYGPAYCSISDFNDATRSYYEDSIAGLSANIELTNMGKNLEYFGQDKYEERKSNLITSVFFLLPGLALIVGYCCKVNPKRPPKIKTKTDWDLD